MLKSLVGLGLLMSATAAWADGTDFGIRTLSGPVTATRTTEVLTTRPLGGQPTINLRSIAGLGSQWGRVTSTYRSPARNRAVGGVRNSYHLRGRAIDIARRPGVSHAQIAAAYRNAGYHLLESLDEGDHSHFAFGSAGRGVPAVRPARQESGGSNATQWRIVSVASAVFK
jgi:hypothetical protein